MASKIVKRCVGDALVVIKPDGRTGDGRCRYKGEVRAGGHRWSFSDLSFHGDCNSPKAFDRAAEEIIGYGSYYTTMNRPDDDDPDGELPEWAPPAKVADAIDEAASMAKQDEQGNMQVKRGPCRGAAGLSGCGCGRKRSRR